MNRAMLVVGLGLLLHLAGSQPRAALAQGSYPRVYGPSGAQYGPTQAHYQYERQHGRTWDGVGGVQQTAFRGGHGHNHGYGYGGHSGWYAPGFVGAPAFGAAPYYGSFGFGGFGGGFGFSAGYGSYGAPGGYYGGYGYTAPNAGWLPPAPLISQAFPLYIGQDPFANSALQGALIENDQRWGGDQPLPAETAPLPVIRQSTPQQQIRSVHLQGAADILFRKQELGRAYSRYREAAAAAPDLAAPRFRMGVTLAAMQQFDAAVAELKRAMQLEPQLPQTGDSLATLFGEENQLAQHALVQEAADWVRADIRDPDRLFLLGVCLHFNGDVDQARTVFTTAARLGNSPPYVMAFLDAAPVPANPGRPVAPALAPRAPQVIDPRVTRQPIGPQRNPAAPPELIDRGPAPEGIDVDEVPPAAAPAAPGFRRIPPRARPTVPADERLTIPADVRRPTKRPAVSNTGPNPVPGTVPGRLPATSPSALPPLAPPLEDNGTTEEAPARDPGAETEVEEEIVPASGPRIPDPTASQPGARK